MDSPEIYFYNIYLIHLTPWPQTIESTNFPLFIALTVGNKTIHMFFFVLTRSLNTDPMKNLKNLKIL